LAVVNPDQLLKALLATQAHEASEAVAAAAVAAAAGAPITSDTTAVAAATVVDVESGDGGGGGGSSGSGGGSVAKIAATSTNSSTLEQQQQAYKRHLLEHQFDSIEFDEVTGGDEFHYANKVAQPGGAAPSLATNLSGNHYTDEGVLCSSHPSNPPPATVAPTRKLQEVLAPLVLGV
jgi:hypothetical protein